MKLTNAHTKLNNTITDLRRLKGELVHREMQSQIEYPLQIYDYIRSARVSLHSAIRELEIIQESEAALARADAALHALVSQNRQTAN